MEKNLGLWLLIGIFYVAIYITLKKKVVYFIKDVGVNFKYYPKHYVLPNRFARKIFNLKKEKIPTYLYVSLWLTFLFLVIGFMELVLFWFVSFMIIAKTCIVSGILNSLIIVIDLVISLFFKKK